MTGGDQVSDTVIDTGNGTGISTTTLRGVIHDEAAFARWVGSGHDPFAAVVGALYRGDPGAAQQELDAVGAVGDGFRGQALQAEIWRDQGSPDRATARYEELLVQWRGTRREAVLQQHLGKAHLAGGRLEAARDCFARALELRSAQQPPVPPDQLASTRAALEHVDRSLGGAR